jgi:hypothetical protein
MDGLKGKGGKLPHLEASWRSTPTRDFSHRGTTVKRNELMKNGESRNNEISKP